MLVDVADAHQGIGLAAGKGVILPGSTEEAEAALRRAMVQRESGAAGDEVVIEDCLVGPRRRAASL